MNYTVYGILQARILEWVAFPFSRGSSQPRDQTQVSHIIGRFFTSSATREAQEYSGVGSLSLLQQIFPTQELNQGLLHCRCILFQLSYQGKTRYSQINKYIFKKRKQGRQRHLINIYHITERKKNEEEAIFEEIIAVNISKLLYK